MGGTFSATPSKTYTVATSVMMPMSYCPAPRPNVEGKVKSTQPGPVPMPNGALWYSATCAGWLKINILACPAALGSMYAETRRKPKELENENRVPQLVPAAKVAVAVAFGPLSMAITGGGTHTPEVQVAPAEQTRPHMPQFCALVWVLVSQPFDPRPSQLLKFGLQAAMVHEPEAQAGVALGTEHTRPQTPHEFTSEFKFLSQPLARRPSQSPKPELQPQVRLPGVFVQVAFAPQPPLFERHSSMSEQATPSPV